MDNNQIAGGKRKRVEDEPFVCHHNCKYKATCKHLCCKTTLTYGAFATSSKISEAAAQVLGTAELTELILGYLSPPEILRALCVCKGFKAVFDSSCTLKTKLWMSYTFPEQRTVWNMIVGFSSGRAKFERKISYQISHEELTRKVLNYWQYSPRSDDRLPVGHLIPMTFNPVLFKEDTVYEPVQRLKLRVQMRKNVLSSSCAKMFLTMPPAQVAAMVLAIETDGGRNSREVTVRLANRDGIKFGDLVRASYRQLFGTFEQVVMERSYLNLMVAEAYLDEEPPEYTD